MDCNSLYQAELEAIYTAKVWPMSSWIGVPTFTKAVIAMFPEGSDATLCCSLAQWL